MVAGKLDISEPDGHFPAVEDARHESSHGPQLTLFTTSDDRGAARASVARWLIFLGYLAIVIFTASHHEMWRDEVRAFSIATDGSLRDMFAELRYEGHPALWYLLLRAGYFITGSRLVLPVLSIVIAASAVYLLLRFSPFSWFQKILIVLGVFPLFEYSVMARNYGLGMLLLVILAVMYPNRSRRALVWGLLLALLANTSPHAAVIAVAMLVGWAWELVGHLRNQAAPDQERVNARRVCLGATIAIAGLVAARLTVSTHRLPDWDAAMPGPARVTYQMAVSAVRPGQGLVGLLPSPLTALGDDNSQMVHSSVRIVAIDLFLLAMVIGWWGRWPLLITGIMAVLGTSTLFRTIYGPSMRHLGLLWTLFLVLYWQVLLTPERRRTIASRRRTFWALTVPLTMVMLLHTIEGIRRVRQDVTGSWSSSKALGALLQRPEYHDAIVLATWDYLLESVPYYAPNRLYFHDQQRFESHVHLRLPGSRDHSLLGVFIAADSLARTTRAPILLLVTDSSLVHATPIETGLLHSHAVEVASLTHAIGDEAYQVYRLRSATPR